jgi:hypothetical protein
MDDAHGWPHTDPANRLSVAAAARTTGGSRAVFRSIIEFRFAHRNDDRSPELTVWEAVYGTAIGRLGLGGKKRTPAILRLGARSMPDVPFVFVRLKSDHVLIVSRDGILSDERLPAEPDLFDPAPTIRAIARS